MSDPTPTAEEPPGRRQRMNSDPPSYVRLLVMLLVAVAFFALIAVGAGR